MNKAKLFDINWAHKVVNKMMNIYLKKKCGYPQALLKQMFSFLLSYTLQINEYLHSSY